MSFVMASLIKHEEVVEWLDEDLVARLAQVSEHAKKNPQMGVLEIVHSIMAAEWDIVLEAHKAQELGG